MVKEITQRTDLFKETEFLTILNDLESLRAKTKDKKALKANLLTYKTLVTNAIIKIREITKIYLDNAFEPTSNMNPFDGDVYIASYNEILESFRINGINKISNLMNEKRAIKTNKQIEKKLKNEYIKANKKEFKNAKFSKLFYEPIVKEIVKSALIYSELVGRNYIKIIKSLSAVRIEEAKLMYDRNKMNIIVDYKSKMSEIVPLKKSAKKKGKKNRHFEIKSLHNFKKTRLSQAKNIKREHINNAKKDISNALIELYVFQKKARNNRFLIK